MVCDRKRESPEYTSVNSRQAAGINAFSTGPQPPNSQMLPLNEKAQGSQGSGASRSQVSRTMALISSSV